MAQTNNFGRCQLYLNNICKKLQLPQWMPGYHFLLSLVYKILPPTEKNAYNFNVTLSLISLLLTFLGLRVLTKNKTVILTTGLLAAFLPLHLKFSPTSSLEIASFTFIMLVTVTALIDFRKQSKFSLYLVFSATAYTILIRPENIILITIPILLAYHHRKSLRKIIMLSLLFIPYFLYIKFIWQYTANNWLAQQSPHLTSLLLNNLTYWVSNESSPLIITLLALVGVYFGWRRHNVIAKTATFYFIALFCIYTFGHQASISCNSFTRLNLQLYPAIILLTALGIKYLDAKLTPVFNKNIIPSLLLLAIFINYANCFNFLKKPLADNIYYQQQQEIKTITNLNNNSLLLAYNPSFVITTINKNCAHISYFVNKKIPQSYSKNNRLILVDDLWCRQDPLAYCKSIKQNYQLKPVNADRKNILLEINN
jgi:hypothetical protein